MIYFIIVILIFLLLYTIIYSWLRNRKMYQTIDRMLDEVLNREVVTVSDIKEGEISALASKVIRLQEKMENELIQAEMEKEQVKGLISNMSHQLKTPLANVMMYRELLEGEDSTAGQKKMFLSKMELQLEKIDWILRSLFKMVGLEQGAIIFESAPSSLRKTLLSAVNAVYEKAEKKNIEIITEPFEDCTLYHNDKWTAEVFVNILENAVKYTETAGKIYIRICPMELFTEIQIEDNGIGIPQSDLPRVFEKGFTGQNGRTVHSSTGIGLYLCKRLCDKLGIGLSVCSQGKGTSVSLIFPINDFVVGVQG